MNRLRYFALVAVLLLAVASGPALYAWSARNQSASQAHTICVATNRGNEGIVRLLAYLEERVRATRPDDRASIDLLEHLKSLAPQVACP